MASSTTMPMASTRPKSESALMLKPKASMMENVPIKETGTAASGADYGAFGTQTVSFGAGSANNATRTVTLAAT